MSDREIFEECGRIETPDSVSILTGMSADNAAETVKDRFDADGKFTDEFIAAWALSVSSVLAYAHEYLTTDEAKEARDWFETRGISY